MQPGTALKSNVIRGNLTAVNKTMQGNTHANDDASNVPQCDGTPAPENHRYALGNGREAIGTALSDRPKVIGVPGLSRNLRQDIMTDRRSKLIGKA